MSHMYQIYMRSGAYLAERQTDIDKQNDHNTCKTMKWKNRTCLSFETLLSAAVEFDLPGLNGLSMRRLTTHTPMTADNAIEVYTEATREPVLGKKKCIVGVEIQSISKCRNLHVYEMIYCKPHFTSSKFVFGNTCIWYL